MMKMVNEHHTYDILPALCHQEKAAWRDVGLGEHDQQDHRGVSCNRALARHLPLQVLDMAVKRSRNISDLHSRFGDISLCFSDGLRYIKPYLLEGRSRDVRQSFSHLLERALAAQVDHN